MSPDSGRLREQVQARYAEAATRAAAGGTNRDVLAVEEGCCTATAPGGAAAMADGCCSAGSCAPESVVNETSGAALYDPDDRAALPAEALAASLGCGNPLVVADLHPGERVLDLGSGGGIDVLLSARRVGPTGFAYGVDMTDEMLELARANAAKAGATNVEFVKGIIEDVPLPDGAVDVVISNCVINLSVDKPAVIAETFRVLRPGGRIGISGRRPPHSERPGRARRLRRLHRWSPVPRGVPRRAGRGRLHRRIRHLHPPSRRQHALGDHPRHQTRRRRCLAVRHRRPAILGGCRSSPRRSLRHPLLAARWSPTTFDASHELTSAEIDALLEAARWAPSAGNSQPWAFIVGRRGDATNIRLVRHLARSSRTWAPAASLLVANLAHRYVEGTDWEYSESSLYDLGQAVAHMTVQAQAPGLSVRQFRAFDRAGLATKFAVPDHWEVTTMAAIGRAAAANAAPPEPRGAAGTRNAAKKKKIRVSE